MKPGIKTIIAGVMLSIFGGGIIPLIIVLPLILEKSKEVQFRVPGTQEVNIEQPGRYYLWNDFQTIYEGRSYNHSKDIPDGVQIKIQEDNGPLLHFFGDTSISSSDNDGAKNSIGYVEIKNPGKVEIDISGGNEQRVFSFGQTDFLRMAGLIIGGIGLSLLVVMSGIGISLWGIAKLIKSGRKVSG